MTEQMPTSTDAVSNHLLVKIAELYFLDDLTQLQISRRLGLSRQKVQRLIRRAGKGHRPDHHSAGAENFVASRTAARTADSRSKKPWWSKRTSTTTTIKSRRLWVRQAPNICCAWSTTATRSPMSWGSTLRAVVDALPGSASRCGTCASSRPSADWAIPTPRFMPAI